MRFVLVLFCLAVVAGCAGGPGRPSPGDFAYRPSQPSIIATPVALFFAGLDENDDAVVTRAELASGLARVFDGTAPDGSVSIFSMSDLLERELGSRQTVPAAAMLDRDGDGQISRSEFIDDFVSRFVELDANSDGRLERSEMLSISSNFERRRPSGEPRRDAPDGRRPPGR